MTPEHADFIRRLVEFERDFVTRIDREIQRKNDDIQALIERRVELVRSIRKLTEESAE